MKTKNLFFTGCIATLAFLVTPTEKTHAATIIADWGGDYVSASRGFVLPTATDTGTTRTYNYSSSTAISPASAYAPPTGKSGTFYGALQSAATGPGAALQSFNAARIFNSGTTDYINVQGDLAAAGATNFTTISGLVFFKKADFLNSLNTGSITFDSTSSFTMDIRTSTGTSARLVRMAVQDGSQWYLSNSSRASAGTFSIANLSSQNYGAWNITSSSAPLPSAPGTFATAGSTFTDIQAVGFYFDVPQNDGNRPVLSINSFSLTAVPEPSSILLLTMGLTSAMIFRRRTGRAF